MVTVGGLLLLWFTSTFWILVKPLYLRRMLSKSMRCTKNCNACRPHWSIAGVQFSMTTTCHAQPTFQKLNELGYEVLLHLPYSPDLSPTEYHFFKHLNLMKGRCFHNQQEAKDAFQEFVESWSTDFYPTGVNKHFSLAKMCWLQWFLFWLIEDVFEPSYNNDLKFRI